MIEDFTQSADISITNINSATASLFTSASLTLTTASVTLNTITFTKGDGTTFPITVDTGSGGGTIDTGSFATTGSNTFVGNQTITSTGNTQLNIESLGAFQTNLEFRGNNSNFRAYGDFRINNNGDTGGSGSIIQTVSNNFIELGADSGIKVGATNGGGNGTDAGNISMQVRSGSLSLAPSGVSNTTASLLHLSSSSNTANVNLMFKNSSTAADTIINGSNNIFVNPSAPTAGFKRYIGTSNHYTHGNSVPQISGSMAWSPSINGNILSHTQINSLTFRGPSSLSSGPGNINHNIVMGGSMNLGTSAVNNFEKATAGVNITGNALFNGTFNQIANTTTLVNTIPTSGNLIFGGQVNLNHISSSISYNSNVTNGSTTVNNRFSPTGASPAILSPRVNTNTLYGTGHVINLDGTNVSATQGKSFSFNILAGTFLTASVPDGDSCNINATGIIGNGLIVSGSTLAVFAGPDTANSGQGSMFAGRFNAQDGNKAKTAETIFAVGTGTSYANRKTGFLIDSGSNSFF